MKGLLPHVEESLESVQQLATITFKYGKYWLFHAKSLQDDAFKNHADRVWRVVKFETHERKENSMRVGQGDIIKFGRVRFAVKKLVVDKSDAEVKSQRSSRRNQSIEDLGASGVQVNESVDQRSMGPRGETIAGFGLLESVDDLTLKQKEQELRLKLNR